MDKSSLPMFVGGLLLQRSMYFTVRRWGLLASRSQCFPKICLVSTYYLLSSWFVQNPGLPPSPHRGNPGRRRPEPYAGRGSREVNPAGL
jgi:hypothetical protein